jgi:hypothetical protein
MQRLIDRGSRRPGPRRPPGQDRVEVKRIVAQVRNRLEIVNNSLLSFPIIRDGRRLSHPVIQVYQHVMALATGSMGHAERRFEIECEGFPVKFHFFLLWGLSQAKPAWMEAK